MGLTFKKIEVRDLRDIESLITENVESIEAGLRIIDSAVLLGHARIDLVGLDAKDSLVLITLGFTGNDEMLLRVLDGYSWCLEYPDTIRRLYPKARTKIGRSERPPRVIFIAESMPDSFLRKIKQFIFPEVDCLRFLHLEVNGTTAVYFDTVERLRRPIAGGTPGDADVPQALDQHPFIEGTPPVAPTIPTNGNGSGATAAPKAALSSPIAEPARGETMPEPEATGGFDQYKGEWQDFLKQLSAEPGAADTSAAASDDLAAQPPLPDRMPTLEATLQPNGSGALGAPDQPRGEWFGARGDAGAPEHPENGSLTREWREFLNQLKAAQ